MLQAVLLAAGKSTRTYPLTTTRPKPLIPILGKPLLEHLLGQLEGLVDEAILVIGYRADAIRVQLGDRFRLPPPSLLGTTGATRDGRPRCSKHRR